MMSIRLWLDDRQPSMATRRCCTSYAMGSQSTMPPPATAWTSPTHRFSIRSLQRKDESRCMSFGCSICVCFSEREGTALPAVCDCPSGSAKLCLRSSTEQCGITVQAINLRGKLEKLAKLENAVWVTSPLTRAVETFLLSCPKRHLLAPTTSQSLAGPPIQVPGPCTSLLPGVLSGQLALTRLLLTLVYGVETGCWCR